MDPTLFLNEIDGLISLAWPEIGHRDQRPLQRWTSVQAIRASLVDRIADGTAKLPCVVVRVGQEAESDYGVATGIYNRPLSVHYIAPAGTPQTDLHRKVSALRRLIDDPRTVFDTFQRGENRGRIDSSETSDVNRNLAEIAGVQVVSASVEWNPGLMVFEPYDA